ncbi:hypothetical protein ES677_01795 [Bizionia gelidisalsuginis]|uniref:Uncharacterized protein n=2 Tax=Bizionia TaxID=283785 RepID=A0A8H2LD96_9FLAO|nr:MULTISPECIES: hypothetical protein [Bizionia]TYB72621.1 hypothetical protein ES676_10630 [Bizionia saleffrena]TYC18137.1 hypothetical protein ES677_01795 [Bizionia gelidisalsuginis]
MSNIEDIVDALEDKIGKILHKLDTLQQDNLKLSEALKSSQSTIQSQNKQLLNWQEEYETLKMANTILGSEDDKRETKLKINALIREIDHCIGQLSE